MTKKASTVHTLSNNQAPVPSVCVRVPNSSSPDSADVESPNEKTQRQHFDFSSSLVVREFCLP